SGSPGTSPCGSPPSESESGPGKRRGRFALVAHRSLDVPDVEQADLALVDGCERMRDERVETRLVDLHVEDPTPPAGTVTVCTLCSASPGFMSPNAYAV